MTVKPLFTGGEWDFDMIKRAMDECGIIAREELKLDTYENQIEVITSEQMLDAYASVGLPIMYKHWSFGKKFSREQDLYKSGKSGLAYELVLNTRPTINYLMEENTACTQVLVIAHAAFGHNHFFKNNYLFKQWTDADGILDYLIFAKNYVADCEEKYGAQKVESTLDSAHALMIHGVDRYKRPRKLSLVKEEMRQKERIEYLEKNINDLWRTLPTVKQTKENTIEKFPKEPEENLLYFLEKNSPVLEPWQRELIRIVRKVAQYFYPQYQCLTGNHLISSPMGLVRLDELITEIGYHKTNNITMLSVGNKLVNASHTYKRKAKVLKLVTGTGKSFTGTPEHPLTILRNGKEMLAKIQDITTQDYLVTNLSYDIFSKNNQKLTYNIDKEKIKCNICGLESDFIGSHLSQKHQINPIDYQKMTNLPVSNEFARIKKSANIIKKIPMEMNKDLAKLLGYMSKVKINDYNSTLKFSHHNKEVVGSLKNIVNQNFGLDLSMKVDKFGLYSVNFNSYSLKKFIMDNFADLGHYSIPLKIRLSSKEVIREYIKSFIDINATNRQTIGRWRLDGYQDHIELFEQIQTILYGFGIVAKITRSNRLTYEGISALLGLPDDKNHQKIVEAISLSIIPDHQSLFDTKIGSDLNHKTSVSTNRNHIIPNAKKLLDSVRNQLISDRHNHSIKNNLNSKSLSHKTKIKNKILIKQNFISSTELPEFRVKEITYGHVLKNWSKFQNLRKCDYIPEAKYLLDLIKDCSGKFYDKIDSISTELEEKYVYDVTIPSNHLFWVDGVISHNTKVMNEGWASFTHYYIMNRLYDKGLITEGGMLEFLKLHTGVLYQPGFDSKHFSGFNPYYLGFEIFNDIKRICENPTTEDRDWFPELIDKNWLDACLDAVANFRDESFIRQFLSPHLMRKLRMFSLQDVKSNTNFYNIEAIHDLTGYREIRNTLASNYELSEWLPKLEIIDADIKNTRRLSLVYYEYKGRKLSDKVDIMLDHIKTLWGHPIVIRSDSGELIAELD